MAVIMTIREKFGYVLVGGIAVAIVLFLLGDALGSGQNLFQNTSNEAGYVDGEPISYLAFSTRLDRNIKSVQLQNNSAEISDEQMSALRNQTWNELVREKLLEREFEKLGIAVTKEEIYQMFFGPNPHEYIAQNFTNPSTGQFDPLLVQNYIDNLDKADGNGSAEEKRARWNNFEQALIRERLEGKYSTLLKQAVYIPKWYSNAYAGLKNASVNVEYVLLPYSSIADDQVKITDSDLKAYLNEHKKEFEQDEYRVLEYVSFNVLPSAQDTATAAASLNEMLELFKEAKNDSTFVVRNSETEYTGLYLTKEELSGSMVDTLFVVDTNTYVGPFLEDGQFKVAKVLDRKVLADSVEVAEIKFQASQQTEFDSLTALADTLVKQINAGTLAFADVLKQYTTDSATLAKGGVLGWVNKNPTELISPYSQRQALYYLKQGQAVLYADNSGLVQITYVTTATPTKPAVKVAYLSKSIVPGKNTEKSYYDLANEFYNDNNTADKFNANNTVNKLTTPKIKKGDDVVGVLGSARELVKASYNAKVGEVLAPQVLEGKYVVAIVKEGAEGGLPSIDAVRSQLEVAVRQQKKADLLKEKIGADKDLNSIATKNSTTVNIAQNLNLNNNTVGAGPEPAVAGAALGLEAGQVSKPVVGKNGVYVIKVSTKTPGTVAEDGLNFEQQIMGLNLRNQLESSYFKALEESVEVVDDRYKFY